jgi:hypothetical protein
MSNVASFRRTAWLSLRFFWRLRLNDFLEARIAAQRVPEGQQFQGGVAQLIIMI